MNGLADGILLGLAERFNRYETHICQKMTFCIFFSYLAVNDLLLDLQQSNKINLTFYHYKILQQNVIHYLTFIVRITKYIFLNFNQPIELKSLLPTYLFGVFHIKFIFQGWAKLGNTQIPYVNSDLKNQI